MTYMTSSATNDGGGSIQVYFEVGTDPDMAAYGFVPGDISNALTDQSIEAAPGR